MKKTTRLDVARKAGVSIATVTYVLRNTPGANISERTRRRVRQAAEQLNYHPSFAATSLVRGRTELIGLLLPSQEEQFTGYYSRMIAGLVSEARESSYHFLYLGQDQPAKYRRCLDEHYVDGVVVLQSRNDESHIRTVLEHDIPTVSMNYLSESPIPAVALDVADALEKSYEFMVSRRRRKVAYFMVDTDIQPNQRQISHHWILKRRYERETEFSFVDLLDNKRQLEVIREVAAEQSWDGFVLESLRTLQEVIRILESQGRRIGIDIDIAAMDIGDNWHDYPPGVLLVEGQPAIVGQTAWKLISALLEGTQPDENTVLVPFLLKNHETVPAVRG